MLELKDLCLSPTLLVIAEPVGSILWDRYDHMDLLNFMEELPDETLNASPFFVRFKHQLFLDDVEKRPLQIFQDKGANIYQIRGGDETPKGYFDAPSIVTLRRFSFAFNRFVQYMTKSYTMIFNDLKNNCEL